MKLPVIFLVFAICLLLAGCAASQQPSAPAAGGGQALPNATGGNSSPALPQNQSVLLPQQAIPAQTGPDLRLNAIEFNASAALNKATNGTVTVYNLGALPSPATSMAYYIDGEIAGTAGLPALQPGQTATAGISFTCSKAGNHTLRVDVDYEKLVNETNRQNNAGTKDFECS